MLEATQFSGQSRSYTSQRGPRRHPECRSCGSSLHGRLEKRGFATVKGIGYAIEMFRCRCGTGRIVRRTLST